MYITYPEIWYDISTEICQSTVKESILVASCSSIVMKMQNVINLCRHTMFILYAVKAVLADSRCTTTNSSSSLPARIVQSPSCYVKCRDVDVNKSQELPSGERNIFQGTRSRHRVYILSTHRYIRTQRKEKENWKETEKRLMSVSSPRLSSFLPFSISFSNSLFYRSIHTRAKMPFLDFFKWHSIK